MYECTARCTKCNGGHYWRASPDMIYYPPDYVGDKDVMLHRHPSAECDQTAQRTPESKVTRVTAA